MSTYSDHEQHQLDADSGLDLDLALIEDSIIHYQRLRFASTTAEEAQQYVDILNALFDERRRLRNERSPQ